VGRLETLGNQRRGTVQPPKQSFAHTSNSWSLLENSCPSHAQYQNTTTTLPISKTLSEPHSYLFLQILTRLCDFATSTSYPRRTPATHLRETRCNTPHPLCPHWKSAQLEKTCLQCRNWPATGLPSLTCLREIFRFRHSGKNGIK